MNRIILVISIMSVVIACEQQKKPTPSASPVFSAAGLDAMPKAADGAEGSGCLADAGPLPDGAWFGFVQGWDAKGIDLDPACFFTGAEAAKAAAARNDETPPPNDFYIANDSKTSRRIAVAPGAKAERVTHSADGGVKNEWITYDEIVKNSGTYQKCPDALCGVWVYVNGGVATEVEMQYLP